MNGDKLVIVFLRKNVQLTTRPEVVRSAESREDFTHNYSTLFHHSPLVFKEFVTQSVNYEFTRECTLSSVMTVLILYQL